MASLINFRLLISCCEIPQNVMNYELAALWNFGQPLSLKYKIACYLQKAFSWQLCFTTAIFLQMDLK